jgi:predicted nuclease of restriction endonuclease-like (RecB) superfamily
MTKPVPGNNSKLFADVCVLINEARSHVASTANSAMTLLYWRIGKRINTELLEGKRAAYGEQIVSQLATQLQQTYGKKGFELRSIRRMMQCADLFPDIQIVSQAATLLSWSHFVELLPLKEEIKREFYLTMAMNERWGRDTLRAKIDGMLYERTLISGKPETFMKAELSALRCGEPVSPDLVFKSPYFLEFTGLKGMYSEKSLEDSLIASLEQFIMELGSGFTFVERQKRMIVDGEDFYLDLLFYHRKLKRLIAIELKIDRFRAAYKGQMELYLRWLDKYERQEGEESPLGLIMCTEGGSEQIELLQLENTGIKVVSYLTELPDKKLLKAQLQKSLKIARLRFNEVSKNNSET